MVLRRLQPGLDPERGVAAAIRDLRFDEDRFPLDATSNLYSGKLTWNVAELDDDRGHGIRRSLHELRRGGGRPPAGPRNRRGDAAGEPGPFDLVLERSQGGTDFGVRATQLFGSQAIATFQGSYHKDENGLTPPDDIRYEDQTCTGGTHDDPCSFPPEPNSITGGYGVVFGSRDHSRSERPQYAAGLTFYTGDHEIKFGGDYQDGRTDALEILHGGPARPIRNEEGQLYYVHSFYAVSFDDPTVVPDQSNSARVLDYGVYLQDSWRAAPGSDGQPGPALGWRADAQLPGSDRLELQRPVAAPRGRRLGPVAKRHDEDLRLCRTLLVRFADRRCGSVASLSRLLRQHVQLRPSQRDSGSGSGIAQVQRLLRCLR